MASPGAGVLKAVFGGRCSTKALLGVAAHCQFPTTRALCSHSTQKLALAPGSTVIQHVETFQWRGYASNPGDEGAKKDGGIEQQIIDNLQSVKSRSFEKHLTNPEELTHFSMTQKDKKKASAAPLVPNEKQFVDPAMVDKVQEPEIGTYVLPHPIWSEEETHNIEITHKEPHGIIDHLALFSIKVIRRGFDALSGYNRKGRDQAVWINRIVFLETVAGVPGMVGGMVRHLQSLRRMRRDHGWIHTLLEEAENERMHLMTALQLKKPSYLFRLGVMGTQGFFVTFFSFAYLISPRFCHRFVGYLEEEAVVTYTKCLQDIETGLIQHWKTQAAPDIAVNYWKLAPDATMKDVILAIRADEAHHRVVNHTLGSLRQDQFNPYKPGQ